MAHPDVNCTPKVGQKTKGVQFRPKAAIWGGGQAYMLAAVRYSPALMQGTSLPRN